MVATRVGGTLYSRSLVRTLLTLLIVMLTLSASGISSAIVASASDDDCCPDGADQKGSSSDEQPGGERDRCPPLCHACACSPAFSVPAVLVGADLVRTPDRQAALEASSQLPVSPPGPDVFHPPRISA